MAIPDDLPEKLVEVIGAIIEIRWLLPLVAVAEIIGSLFIILPKTRALGAIILFPIMIYILLINI